MLRACSLFIHSIHTNHAPCRHKVLLALMQNEVARGHLQLRAPLLAPTSTARSSAIVGEEQGGRGSGAPRVLVCTAAAARAEVAGRRGGESQDGLVWGWSGLGCRLWWPGQAEGAGSGPYCRACPLREPVQTRCPLFTECTVIYAMLKFVMLANDRKCAHVSR